MKDLTLPCAKRYKDRAEDRQSYFFTVSILEEKKLGSTKPICQDAERRCVEVISKIWKRIYSRAWINSAIHKSEIVSDPFVRSSPSLRTRLTLNGNDEARASEAQRKWRREVPLPDSAHLSLDRVHLSHTDSVSKILFLRIPQVNFFPET